MKFLCSETNKSIFIKNFLDYKKRSFAVKNHISKSGHSLNEILKKKNIIIKNCVFCTDPNMNFYLLTEINEDKIFITGIEYIHRKNSNLYKIENYCWGANKECPGRQLNPNSKEFISKVLGVSIDEAVDIIHSRNKSPFYKKNHSSDLEYHQYQSRSKEWFEKNKKDREDWINKAKYARSEKGYLDRFGEDGSKRWNKVQKSKAITLENLISKYGNNEGHSRWIKWKHLTNINYDTFIRKYGRKEGALRYFEFISKKSKVNVFVNDYDSFLVFCYEILKRNSFYKLKSFSVLNYLKKYSFFNIGTEYFEILENQFLDDLKQRYLDINLFDITPSNREKYGQVFFTANGRLLRSINEMNFYTELLKFGVNETDIIIDGCYPKSNLRFDFYIKPFNMYIEIAGMNDLDWYSEKMNLKKKLFNPVILEPENIDTFLKELKGNHGR